MIERIKAAFRYINRKIGNHLVVVEIGTLAGRNAIRMLKILPIKKIYLIDPWLECPDFTQAQLDYHYKEAARRLRKYKEKVVIIRKFSSDAVDDIPNGVDFVYVDGNHEYEAAKEDMENYYKKVREGGIIAGHDVLRPPVIKALCEFTTKENQQAYIADPDWWVIKKTKGN